MKLYLIISRRKHGGNTWMAMTDVEASRFIAESNARGYEAENPMRVYRVIEIERPFVETPEQTEARLGAF